MKRDFAFECTCIYVREHSAYEATGVNKTQLFSHALGVSGKQNGERVFNWGSHKAMPLDRHNALRLQYSDAKSPETKTHSMHIFDHSIDRNDHLLKIREKKGKGKSVCVCVPYLARHFSLCRLHKWCHKYPKFLMVI